MKLKSSNKNATKRDAENITKRKNKFNFNKFTRLWAILYLLALMVFELALIIINVLPGKILIATLIILGLLSVIVFTQLFFPKINKKSKIAATLISTVLILFFSIATSYAVGTNSFISKLSEGKSKYAVSVTEKPFSVYISGRDFSGTIEEEDGRSDVNMIVTVNPRNHRILLTSIPRDYEIKLVDYNNATDKLTHTGIYGIKTSMSSIEEMLGIKMNYYLKVNFSTITSFIDAIGGITVQSEKDFSTNSFGEGDKYYHFKKGPNNIDGRIALAFARERNAFNDGDNQRIRNQQIVFQAILDKCTSSKTILSKYNKILGALGDYMRTDMSENEIKSIVRMQLDDMPSWTIEKYDLSGHDANKTTYSGGSQKLYVMEQDAESIATAKANIQTVMYDAIDEKAKEKISGKITVAEHVMTPKEKEKKAKEEAKAKKKKK